VHSSGQILKVTLVLLLPRTGKHGYSHKRSGAFSMLHSWHLIKEQE